MFNWFEFQNFSAQIYKIGTLWPVFTVWFIYCVERPSPSRGVRFSWSLLMHYSGSFDRVGPFINIQIRTNTVVSVTTSADTNSYWGFQCRYVWLKLYVYIRLLESQKYILDSVINVDYQAGKLMEYNQQKLNFITFTTLFHDLLLQNFRKVFNNRLCPRALFLENAVV